MIQRIKWFSSLSNKNYDVFAFLLSLIITSWLFIQTEKIDYYHEHFPLAWDHHKYIFMALNNLDFHIAPFCWRIFVPFVASLLPFELSINFQVIAFISLVLTGYFNFLIGKIFFQSDIYGLGMMMAYFSLNFATKYVIYDFWLPDAFAIFLITAAIYSIIIKNDFLFSVIILIGSFTKESVLFVIPLYYSLNSQKFFDKRLFIKTVVYFVIALITVAAIRISIPAFNNDLNYISKLPEQLFIVQRGNSIYDLKYLFKTIGMERLSNLSIKFIYDITIYVFMIYFILMFMDVKSTFKLFIKFLPFLLLVYSQILFAENMDRLIVIAYPFVLLGAFSGLSNFTKAFSYNKYFLLVLISIYLLLSMNHGIFYLSWLIIRQILVFLLLAAAFKIPFNKLYEKFLKF